MSVTPHPSVYGAPSQEWRDAAGLHVHLLGRFSVQLAGFEVPEGAFARRKSRSLLKFLALQPGHRLHREQVTEALWPGLSPPGGAAQLYKAVYQVRRALRAAGTGPAPEDVLVLQDQELRLEAPGGVSTDVQEFRRLGQRALRGREGAELERALAAYGGELLPTDLYEEWTLEPREALREEAAALTLALGEVRLLAGELPGALDAFHHTLRLDPLREAAHCGVMQVHAGQGNRAALERQYRRCAEGLAQALDATPAPETTRLYHRLLQGPPPAPRGAPHSSAPAPDRPRHNLPAQPSPFVGRARELAEIAGRWEDPECRLLTLLGPGGVGKTRLGLQAAAERLEDFAGGVFWVPMAGVAGPGGLAGAVAEALRVMPIPGVDPRALLLERLGGQSVLLMLDNFEHLLGGGALIAELLDAVPRLRLLVTSRERLGLRREWLFEVAGLDHSAAQGGTGTSGAVRLFLGHLRRVQPHFVPARADLEAIERICGLVEGFPLSLELAAAQGRFLSCAEIAGEIERGLGVLEAGLRDLPERHRSQRAAFEPSWQSLSPHERQVFAALSVFRGGFRREAAQAVAGATLPVLAALTDKSLLRRAPSGRYELHELLRQFGEEKLGAAPEGPGATRDRHARFFCGLLARQEPRLKGPDHLAALEEVAGEQGNLRAAWRWAARGHDLGLLDASLGAMWVFGASRGRLREEEALLDEVIGVMEGQGVPAADLTLVRLRAARAGLAYRLGLHARAQAELEDTAALFRRLGTGGDLAFALHHLAAVRHLRGDYAGEQTLLRESIALSRAVGDAWLTAYSFNDLGLAAHRLGDEAEAERLCTESLRLFGQVGDPRGRAYTLGNLGVITRALGRPREARDLLRAALALARENADAWAAATNLLHLSDLAAGEDGPQEARDLAREALRLAERERIPGVAPGALIRLAALAPPEEAEQALGWLSLVLAHPSTSRGDWEEARRLRGRLAEGRPDSAGGAPGPGLSAAPEDRLSIHEAATRLEAVTAQLLGLGAGD